MNRLEIITDLKELEERKISLKSLLDDLRSPYTKRPRISIDMEGENYGSTYDYNLYLGVSEGRLIQFIESELKALNITIEEKISLLVGE